MRAHNQVARQIEVVEKEASDQGISPYKLMDLQGNFMLTPLLAAKAQLLHALTLLNQKDG